MSHRARPTAAPATAPEIAPHGPATQTTRAPAWGHDAAGGVPSAGNGLARPDDRLLRAFPAKSYDVASAQGVWLTTSNGPRIMDLGGASHGAALIGHSHPAVVTAIQEAAGRAIHVNGNVTSPDRSRFLDALHTRLPSELTQTFLANSGTEAVECAIKLAIAGGRSQIVALEGGFHGRTLGALAVTSRESFRAPFAGRLAPTHFVPPGDVPALLSAVTDDTAAIILEPILGEAGVHEVPAEFLQAARETATRHGALLIVDEVQTGLGRTGTFLACEAAGIVPDIVTLGKGLAGGLPIGACSVTAAVAASLPPGGHGSTYGGGPLVCAAGSAVLGVLDHDMLARAAEIGGRFRTGLAHPAVASVRGRGAMLALELRLRSATVLPALEREGVAALSAGPRSIRLLPPLTITDGEIDDACARIRRALDG